MHHIRMFVLYGQGGVATSFGMNTLADRLKQFGEVSTHNWNDVSVIPAINKHEGKVAVYGYSLGANQLGWIDTWAKRQIDLGVAYDPSKQSPLVRYDSQKGEWVQYVHHYDRFICYYHPGAWLFGGSTFAGNNVEVEGPYRIPHLLFHQSRALHDYTVEITQILYLA